MINTRHPRSAICMD